MRLGCVTHAWCIPSDPGRGSASSGPDCARRIPLQIVTQAPGAILEGLPQPGRLKVLKNTGRRTPGPGRQEREAMRGDHPVRPMALRVAVGGRMPAQQHDAQLPRLHDRPLMWQQVIDPRVTHPPRAPLRRDISTHGVQVVWSFSTAGRTGSEVQNARAPPHTGQNIHPRPSGTAILPAAAQATQGCGVMIPPSPSAPCRPHDTPNAA